MRKINVTLVIKATPKQIADKYKAPIAVVNRELNKGIAIEHEHTKNKQVAKKIAIDHLLEDLYYYRGKK